MRAGRPLADVCEDVRMTASTNARRGRTTWRPTVTPLDLVDVLVYVVVLNLAIEFLPAVISETFTLSLLTAVLLKLVLELVMSVRRR